MTKLLKILLGVIVLIALAFSIVWTASFAFRLLFSLQGFNLRQIFVQGFHLTEQVRSQPFDIFHYMSHYIDSYPKQIEGAWMLAVGSHVLVIALVLYIIFRRRPDLYGNARFATLREIRKAGLIIPQRQIKKGGLFAGKSIIFARMGNQYLGVTGPFFGYLAAPSRSGKGVGVVVPVGLSYSDSIVALDIKQELFDLTAAVRADNGHEVHLFDPFSPEGRTARWNPCSYIRRDLNLRINDINAIAICLIPDNVNGDNFFPEAARSFFTGLALYCLDKEAACHADGRPYTTTIKGILNLAMGSRGDEAISYFASLIKDKFVSDEARRAISAGISAGDKTFGSILTTVTTNLTPWMSQTVADATSSDDFDLRDVRRKKMSIYFGVLPSDLSKAEKIINLFYTQLINANTNVLPQRDSGLKYECLLLMDEASAPGRIAIIAKALSYMAGYGLRLLIIVQSPAQLRDPAIYGEYGTRNILSNMALKIMYKPDDLADAEEYAKRLGKVTIQADTQRSRGGGNKGVSRTETFNSRDLMLPQEILEMGDDIVLATYRHCKHPIKATKNNFLTDPIFANAQQKSGRLIAMTIAERTDGMTKLRNKIARVADTSAQYQNITVEMKNRLLRPLADFIIDELTQ